MAWIYQNCILCAKQGKLQIGRNIDNTDKKVENCPICEGKGWLSIYLAFFQKLNKRISGEY